MDCHSQFINVTGTDNKPIVFFNSSVQIQNWNNNVSEIILCGADYSVIDNLTMNYTDKKNNGLILVATQHTNITNSLFANLYEGIFIKYGSNYNQLVNITTVDNYQGIYLRYADSNTFENTSVTGGDYGVDIETSKRNRDLIVKEMSEIKGIECPKPPGAFYIFPTAEKLGLSGTDLMFKLLDHGVAIAPGELFGENFKHHFRMCYAMPENLVKEGLERIKNFFQRLEQGVE